MPNRNTPKMKSLARKLRSNATDTERLLWRELRALNAQGCHFRRQAPFDFYVLDFVEHSRLLVIEIDGDQHGLPENRIKDERRDRYLRGRGYAVLRVSNNDVRKNMDGVIREILRLITPTRNVHSLPLMNRFDLLTRGR